PASRVLGDTGLSWRPRTDRLDLFLGQGDVSTPGRQRRFLHRDEIHDLAVRQTRPTEVSPQFGPLPSGQRLPSPHPPAERNLEYHGWNVWRGCDASGAVAAVPPGSRRQTAGAAQAARRALTLVAR